MKKTAIVYWLLPSKPKRELFCEIVRILCDEFDAPNFEPHLTLLATAQNRISPAKVLRQIRSGPIRLQVRGAAFSSQFTKTLFVRFKPNNLLAKLVLDLGRAAQSPNKHLRDPHVSLVYKRLPTRLKKELAATIKLPFREVLFDKVAAVRCPAPTKTRAQVKAWKILAKKSLRQ
jgi:2'-5' RNA ligase